MKIIEVVWFDAQTSTQHLSVKNAKKLLKPLLTKSVGFLVNEEKDYLLLSFMKFGDESFKHWQVIPSGMIKSKKYLK